MKKFQIPYSPLTTNKCIRFPNDLIEDVETVIKDTTCTFTAFVVNKLHPAIKSAQVVQEIIKKELIKNNKILKYQLDFLLNVYPWLETATQEK